MLLKFKAYHPDEDVEKYVWINPMHVGSIATQGELTCISVVGVADYYVSESLSAVVDVVDEALEEM